VGKNHVNTVPQLKNSRLMNPTETIESEESSSEKWTYLCLAGTEQMPPAALRVLGTQWLAKISF
jgi:hypothetical protein